jgi:inosine/xanthosine triphosphatase
MLTERNEVRRVIVVAVGSKNPAKIKAVLRLCEPFGWKVISVDAPSGVSAMPRSDQETRDGAIYRSKRVLEMATEADIGIGLEGGVMDIGDDMFLSNWGALSDRSGRIISASGARIVLPSALKEGIQSGKELGEVIDIYTEKKDVRKCEGTIGILTNGHVTRDDMFYHVASLLFGQYEYQGK